jgi:NitT/TauT family transport system substrate-binding protein
MAMLARGEVDAFLGFPPEPQQLQAQEIGHVVVNTATDKPWSQYYCCMVVGNRSFVQQHPVATRRALRAILKATDICATDPSKVAEALVSRGYLQDRALAEQVLRDVPYSHWREYDPEDTSRFYALKMHEAGMVKTSPNELIARSADWRFFNELKQELKA